MIDKATNKPVLITSALYVGALMLATGYGAFAFGEYYEPPAFSRFGAPAAPEDELIAAYEKALTGEFGQYRTYARGIALTLAIWLGVASALFGSGSEIFGTEPQHSSQAPS